MSTYCGSFAAERALPAGGRFTPPVNPRGGGCWRSGYRTLLARRLHRPCTNPLYTAIMNSRLASFLLTVGVTLPMVAATAFGVAAESREGTWDCYVIGGAIVLFSNAALAYRASTSAPRAWHWRRAAPALWVLMMPLVAGGWTGLALATLHPKKDGVLAIIGGAGIGLTGSILFYPFLLIAAIAVWATAWFCMKVRDPGVDLDQARPPLSSFITAPAAIPIRSAASSAETASGS